jgi:hypothetical protein
VVGFNTTTNSDARIFSADGNRTMQSFAMDPDFFVSRCGALLETMLNTVPAGVTLSDVIEPLVVKPHELRLFFTSTGGLTLSGNIRVRRHFLSGYASRTEHWNFRKDIWNIPRRSCS